MSFVKHPAVLAAVTTIAILLIAKNVDAANKFLFKQS